VTFIQQVKTGFGFIIGTCNSISMIVWCVRSNLWVEYDVTHFCCVGAYNYTNSLCAHEFCSTFAMFINIKKLFASMLHYPVPLFLGHQKTMIYVSNLFVIFNVQFTW